MNLKTIINLCVIFMCLTLCSCSQDEEVYSCDPKVDAWVKENLADIHKMSREDWLKLDENVKRSTLAAFTPNQKQIFWKEKMNEVLSLDWSDVEKNHIQKLYAMIANNPQWFADDFLENERELERFEIFTFEWQDYAEEKLGWNGNQIGSIIASGNKLTNITGTLEYTEYSSVRLRSGKPTCDCTLTSSSGPDYLQCHRGQGCKETPCQKIKGNAGCGPMGLTKCNGLCG
jgi:hypothetical protein